MDHARKTRAKDWRWIAGLAALALVLQGLTLYAPRAAAEAPYGFIAALSKTLGLAEGATVLCVADAGLASDGQTPSHRHNSSDCPMCQTIGAALPGASLIASLALPAAFAAPRAPIMAAQAAPRASPHFAVSPRGPPILV